MRTRTSLSVLLAATLAASLAVLPAAAEPEDLPPTDYIAQADTLSQPDYPETVTEAVTVTAFDDVELYVEITKPDPEVYPDLYADGGVPVVLEASPYHGTIATRIGDRMFPDPVDEDGAPIGLVGYFPPRGYAVAMMGLRGTGRSEGCLDHLGPNDAEDLKTVIEWLAGQDWSNGRVGMTGHSYVGSTPSVAAAQNPEGLVTIIPSAGLASMYDHQFQKGVPWALQWVGPMAAYPGLSVDRDLPPGLVGYGGTTGDNFDYAGPNPDFGCGLASSAAISGTGQVTGQYQDWHAERDWREGAANADIPIFMIHGVHDNAARIPASEWFFADRDFREDDKVWIGQWDHGSTNGRCGDQLGNRTLHPTCRFEQMQYAIHAWFDYHLKEMTEVHTGPPVEAFLNGEELLDLTEVLDPEQWGTRVLTDTVWRTPETLAGLYPDATDGSLGFEPPEEDGASAFPSVSTVALYTTAVAEFVSEPLAEDTVFAGLPELDLRASVTNSQSTHLIATLYRQHTFVDDEGDEQVDREPLTWCAIQTLLREGIETVTPVTPGEEMALPMQCFTMASWVPAGQQLVLTVGTGSPHHVTYNQDAEVTVHTGPGKTALGLPVVPDVTLHDDVPLRPPEGDHELGPAQPGEGDTLVIAGSGAGERIAPVNSAYYEFEVLEGYDNASLEVVATPLLTADLDLYLQRQVGDGWRDLNRAENDTFGPPEELTLPEVLNHGRLAPGSYRIEVHNWLGSPTTVELELTFFNQEGEPGT